MAALRGGHSPYHSRRRSRRCLTWNGYGDRNTCVGHHGIGPHQESDQGSSLSDLAATAVLAALEKVASKVWQERRERQNLLDDITGGMKKGDRKVVEAWLDKPLTRRQLLSGQPAHRRAAALALEQAFADRDADASVVVETVVTAAREALVERLPPSKLIDQLRTELREDHAGLLEGQGSPRGAVQPAGTHRASLLGVEAPGCSRRSRQEGRRAVPGSRKVARRSKRHRTRRAPDLSDPRTADQTRDEAVGGGSVSAGHKRLSGLGSGGPICIRTKFQRHLS